MQIGTDILSLKRLKRVFEKFPAKFSRKILTDSELRIYESISNERRRLEFLGGRFCGKEAIFKAAASTEGRSGLTWQRVEVLRDGEGKPIVFIDSKKEDEKKKMKISISHEEDFVIATAINLE